MLPLLDTDAKVCYFTVTTPKTVQRGFLYEITSTRFFLSICAKGFIGKPISKKLEEWRNRTYINIFEQTALMSNETKVMFGTMLSLLESVTGP